MFSRWSRLLPLHSMAGFQEKLAGNRIKYSVHRAYSNSVERAVHEGKNNDSLLKDCKRADVDLDGARSSYQVFGNKAFMSKPCSLALAPNSKLRVEEPEFDGFRRFMLKLLMFYSHQSKAIRGANVLYQRIVFQVDRTDIYNTFNLEKCFRTTFALLVLHMWLCLARLKAEGKEGAEFGQYLYEIYNHDLELRVSAAGVNLLLTRWMKDLEKIFYGNVAAYDAAMLPEAAKDELSRVIWRNVFSDEDTPLPSGSSAAAVQALARYIRREHACLALTDKEALFSGNLMFSSLHKPSSQGTPLQS